MPKRTIWDSMTMLSVLIITACGLFITTISVFRLDESAYYMLVVLGLDSVFLGIMVLRQRRELMEMRKNPEGREEIINE